MPLIDLLFASARVRKAIWKLWYPFVTRRLRDEDVLFLNYAYEEDPPMALPLDPADEPNRACIQLYHHVATQTKLREKTVLEVSCGHGGGASYLARALRPAQYTGLDLNPTGIAFCRKRHGVEGLTFVQGDAQDLPFAKALASTPRSSKADFPTVPTAWKNPRSCENSFLLIGDNQRR